MSIFDGTNIPVPYAEALTEAFKRISWPSEQHQFEAIKAVQVEHGVYIVPEAETRQLELERLRALAAEADLVARDKAQEAEIALLQEKLGLVPAAAAAGVEPETLA